MKSIDHFQIPEEELRKVLDIAMSRGGEFAEIFLEYRLFNYIHMEEDLIKETAETISKGLGIRTIFGNQTGYAYTNNFDFASLKRAARTSASIAASGGGQKSLPIIPLQYSHQYYPVSRTSLDHPLKTRISLVQKSNATAQAYHNSIKKVTVSFSDQMRYIRVINSQGLSVTDVRPMVRLSCIAIAEKNGLKEAGYSGGGGRVGLEYFEHELKPETIGEQAAGEAVHLLDADPPPAGEMPVVLAPGHSGVLIHEAVGHLLEADFHRKKTSIFWNKMGQTVGNEQVTIYDDPTIPHFRGSYNVDDEGTLPIKTELIGKGILSGLLHDRLSARLMNHKLTGHGRRQDYSCIPIPRMSNTYIDRGEYQPEEILGSVDRGFYALHYQGGQVEDSGKFTFTVSSGYLIEGGKLTRPVKQATLIGSNLDILKKISMVGSDLQFGLQTGTCGKEGQSSPVTDGCPTLKISLMTVGGQS